MATTEIAGKSFEASPLPYFRAQRLLVRMLKMGGPLLVDVLQAGGGGNGVAALAQLMRVEASGLAGALAGFFAQLSPEEAETITREILATCQVNVNGKSGAVVPVLDAIFAGDFWAGLVLQGWALTVHFGNFSTARSALEGLGLKIGASKESSTSTDGKGETSS